MIQEYKESKIEFTDNDILVTIRFLDFPNWKIFEPIEMYVNQDTTFMELGDKVVKHYPKLFVRNLIYFNKIL